ncbi:MAG: hypothetical protein AB7F79_02905 [Steroidobacteraceae bacterium]
MSAIGLVDQGKLPVPDLIVSFRGFSLSLALAEGTKDPLRRVVQVADTNLKQGQGTHGGFGRESTFNCMAAIGPDFKRAFVDN